MLYLDDATRITAGIVLLTIVGIEYGGLFLFGAARRNPAFTEFQRSFFRAGHAHAGVLVILGLICLVLVSATGLDGFWRWLGGTGVLIAAILMPAGFFFSAAGRARTQPNRWVGLLFAGAGLLAAGVITLGFGLLTA